MLSSCPAPLVYQPANRVTDGASRPGRHVPRKRPQPRALPLCSGGKPRLPHLGSANSGTAPADWDAATILRGRPRWPEATVAEAPSGPLYAALSTFRTDVMTTANFLGGEAGDVVSLCQALNLAS